MHISWLSRAGGACTCQRGMWTLWFNPGKGSWGPCSEGQKGAQHSCFSKSKGETVVCLACFRDDGGASPSVGKQLSGLLPPSQLGLYSQIRHFQDSGREVVGQDFDLYTSVVLLLGKSLGQMF